MLRGIYSSGTAMLTQQKKMDVITNNIANANTTGFKEDKLVSRSFKDMLISRMNDPSIVNSSNEVGPYNTGIHIDQVLTDFSTGSITETGNYTDFAIIGDGFFAIDTQNGERYTKDGSFSVDADGYLVNNDGLRVLGQNGAINVGAGEFTVNLNGEIYVDGNYVDKFKLVSFTDATALRKEGNNIYNNTANGNDIQSNSQIRQSALEASNGDLISNLVDMMTVYRNYESNQRVIQIQDSTLGKVVELGKV